MSALFTKCDESIQHVWRKVDEATSSRERFPTSSRPTQHAHVFLSVRALSRVHKIDGCFTMRISQLLQLRIFAGLSQFSVFLRQFLRSHLSGAQLERPLSLHRLGQLFEGGAGHLPRKYAHALTTEIRSKVGRVRCLSGARVLFRVQDFSVKGTEPQSFSRTMFQRCLTFTSDTSCLQACLFFRLENSFWFLSSRVPILLFETKLVRTLTSIFQTFP